MRGVPEKHLLRLDRIDLKARNTDLPVVLPVMEQLVSFDVTPLFATELIMTAAELRDFIGYSLHGTHPFFNCCMLIISNASDKVVWQVFMKRI